MVENSDKTEDSPESRQGRTSCVKYFDALWFCYSPVHQLKRYYVYGDVDDCLGHWSKLMACLRQKTRFRDEDDRIHRDGECLWQLRSPEEAAAFWTKEFSQQNDDEHNDETQTT